MPTKAGRAQSWSSATGTNRSSSPIFACDAAGTRTSSYPLCVVLVVPGGKTLRPPPRPPELKPRSAAKISSSVAARSFFSLSSARSQSPSKSAPNGTPADKSHSNNGSPSPRAKRRPTLRASFLRIFSSFLSSALVMVTEALGAPDPPPRGRSPFRASSASKPSSSPKRRRAAAIRVRSASAMAPLRSTAPTINSTPESPKKSKSSAATASSDFSSGEANARRATVCAASSQWSFPEISRHRALSHANCSVAAEAAVEAGSFCVSSAPLSFLSCLAAAIEAARVVS